MARTNNQSSTRTDKGNRGFAERLLNSRRFVFWVDYRSHGESEKTRDDFRARTAAPNTHTRRVPPVPREGGG